MKSLDKDEVVDFDESITFNTDMSEVNDVSFMKLFQNWDGGRKLIFCFCVCESLSYPKAGILFSYFTSGRGYCFAAEDGHQRAKSLQDGTAKDC